MSEGNFGRELGRALSERAWCQMDLIRRMGSNGDAISRSYVSAIILNQRTPPPDIIDKICHALKLPREQVRVFHRAAALDNGYEIGALR